MVDKFDPLRAAAVAANLTAPRAAIPSHPLGVDEIRLMEILRLQGEGLQAAVPVDPDTPKAAEFTRREIDLDRRRIIQEIPIVLDTTPNKI